MRILTRATDRLWAFGYWCWGRRLGRGRRSSQAKWDDEYQRGGWDFLGSADERQRYRVLVELCSRWKRRPAVLDVACGEGLLLDHFQVMGLELADYLGLDISREAVARAQTRYPQARFEVADAEKYLPTSRYDLIVWNECLYYFRNPLAVLLAFEAGLADDGLTVVSMYAPADQPDRHAKFWEIVRSRYECLEEKASRNRRSTQWQIGVFRRRAGQ